MVTRNQNTDNVRVYGAQSDMIAVAPLGTPDPEISSAEDLLKNFDEQGYADLGWLMSDGIPLSVSTDVEKFPGHQGGATMRVKVTSTEKGITIGAAEENPLVTKLFFDHGDPTIHADGVARIDLPKGIGTVAVKAIVVVSDGDVTKMIVIQRLEIGEREDVNHANAELTGYQMQAEITGDAYILTNAASYVEAANGEGSRPLEPAA